MPSQATRIEQDTHGPIAVAEDKLWGAQTQRSLENFAISNELLPLLLLHCLALIKKAAAEVNVELQILPANVGAAIGQAADEVRSGKHDAQFPLVVWQTGSGTQSNMNMNEVLANRASEILGGGRGAKRVVHPNDHVNLSQSSNDVFPAAMAVACTTILNTRLLPVLEALHAELHAKAVAFADVIKIGRTHLMDATPLTLGQEISGWAAQLQHCMNHLRSTLPHLSELSLGGTAVGTGLNAHPAYAERVARKITELSGLAFVSAPNKFESLAAHDAIVFAHGALKTLAAASTKIANDIRWLASGPRSGLGEITIPENEPGSSIMPGKVNPTQCEALTMVAAQVFGNDVTINFSGSQGAFELNVYKPVIAHNFLQSARLLADALDSFRKHCVNGIEPNRARIAQNLENSLMLVTALNPHIGYENAAKIAKKAHQDGTSLRVAALALGLVTNEQFEAWVRPAEMLGSNFKK